MQDRFKFRAWDIEESKYASDDDIFSDSCGQVDGVYDLMKFDDPDYIIEQCTGCTDCSGQLIYDGDILEIPEDNGISYVKVYFNDEFLKWDIDGDTEGDYEFYDLVKRPCDTTGIDDIGVVGNIHENPELLEGKINDRID